MQLRCSVIIVIIAIFDRAFCSSSFSFIPRQFLVVIIETNLAWRLGASVRSNEKFIAMSFRSDFLQKSLTSLTREKIESLCQRVSNSFRLSLSRIIPLQFFRFTDLLYVFHRMIFRFRFVHCSLSPGLSRIASDSSLEFVTFAFSIRIPIIFRFCFVHR